MVIALALPCLRSSRDLKASPRELLAVERSSLKPLPL
jgi:hypothetical protein